MAETPTFPTPSSRRKTTTTRSTPTPAPDARTIAPPVTKKRTLNDGPTGRARRAKD